MKSLWVGLVIGGLVAGCGDLPDVRLKMGAGDARPLSGFAGLIAADEPEAALTAQNILRAGGSAADAAVALGFALAVTLPSQAGLGGGGACLVHDARSGVTEALDFTAPVTAHDDGARYRAAVPATPRGLFALHAKYGKLPWPQVVAPAENLARFGHRVSRAFAGDLAADGASLANDRVALTAFMTPRRQMVQAGDSLVQLNLAATLGRLRARGPGDFYAGGLARELEDAIAAAGGAVTAADLRAFVPQWAAVAGTDEGSRRVFAFPDVPSQNVPSQSATPASDTSNGATSFVVSDTSGDVVACLLSMGRAFGLGIMPAGSGMLLAPAPDAPGITTGALTARIAVDRAGAPSIDAEAHARFTNKLACGGAENATPASCQAQSDPKSAGYAIRLDSKE